MSNFLAVATVTATLQTLLTDAVAGHVPGSSATVARPEATVTGSTVTIYLYHVTPNSAWRNNDLPTRNRQGQLTRRPRIALDLHYLFSFFGTEADFVPQRLLGSVVSTLHARPLLSRSQIESVVAATPELTGSDLGSEVETVKFVPLSLNLEELSRLWSVFFQTPYVLSVAYLATTVLIEAEETPSAVLPVESRVIDVHPFAPLQITQLQDADGDQLYFDEGDIVTIVGQHFSRVDEAQVGEARLTPDRVSATEVVLTLSDPGLRAGAQALRLHSDRGAVSNPVPIVIRPAIALDPGGDPLITIDNLTTDPVSGVRSARVRVTTTQDVGPDQPAELVLNPVPGGPDLDSYQFSAVNRTNPDPVLEFAIRNFAAGDYLVRINVSGAQSRLTQDGSGIFDGPQVTLP